MADQKRSKVTVKVPATTANLGPGYDCVGMAVDIWNTVTVEIASRFSMHIDGEGADVLPRDDTNYIVMGVKMAYTRAGQEVPPLAYYCQNNIPFGSGLGSSSAAIVAGLMAGLVLTGQELEVAGKEELLQLAAQVEGHIDNLSPCIYGGIQLGIHTGQRWDTTGVAVPAGMQCVVFTPSTPMNTQEARAMLGDQVSREDAIFNISRSCLLIHALMTQNFDELEMAMQDRMHQPVRGSDKVMPALFPVINAAVQHGAKGAFLSGAGSSIMAITVGARGDWHTQNHLERRDAQVAAAMTEAAKSKGVHGRVIITKPSPSGAHVVSVSETPKSLLASKGHGMTYQSTRDEIGEGVSFEYAVMEGLARDGGLYVPSQIPRVTEKELAAWKTLSYEQLAFQVMSKYISTDEIPSAILEGIVTKSYSKFGSAHVTPLIPMSDDVFLLEQFHGPTCAFKDVALQFVGHLFEYFITKREANSEPITILGATSGDTGSAAIEGLRGKKGVEVFILHPHKRVAPIQEAQMTTVLDPNVHNISVSTDFDGCQSMVKACFGDIEFRNTHRLAAVNSINWARILAQIVYYFYSYFRFQELCPDSGAPNFAVPTGNFGNMLAGFYAKQMGLPVGKLVVATNQNDILYRFLAHSDYSARPVVPSLAPAMDIVVPSNFERYLFFALNNDGRKCKELMATIKSSGTFNVSVFPPEALADIKATFAAGRADDQEIQAITEVYRREHGYLLCPHTAAGMHVMRKARSEGVSGPFICFATAHPAKFGDVIHQTDDSLLPCVPTQLQGLLDMPRRCEHIGNSLQELKALVAQKRDERMSAAPVNAALPPSTWQIQDMAMPVATFAAGVALSLLAGRLFK